MLAKRVITGFIVAITIIASVLFLPPLGFTLLIVVIGIVAGVEWAKLCGDYTTRQIIGYILILVGWYLLLTNLASYTYYIVGAATLGWVALLGYLSYPTVGGTKAFNCIICSILIISIAMFAAVELHHFGAWWVLGALASVAIADIGAFFIGRTFGKHKLAKHISPGKTIEGLVGGLAASSGFALIVGFVVWGGDLLNIGSFVFVCLVAAALSVVGDLYVSKMKRFAGVKDSGSLLPGHGGVLDRIDGILAGLPVFTFLVTLLSF